MKPGILLLDKPSGWTSSKVVQAVKNILKVEKIGHTGTLDPLATGVLVLVIGEATKFSQYGLNADKSYEAVIQLGVETDTLDAGGNITKISSVPPLSSELIESVLKSLRGEIKQIPPVFSALKKNGIRYYKLARSGVPVLPEARRVVVHKINLTYLDSIKYRFCLDISCSKGTYIRSLAEAIGQKLGSGAHILKLNRTGSGNFKLSDCISLAELEFLASQDLFAVDKLLIPVEALVDHLPQLFLDSSEARKLLNGQPLYRQGREMCHTVALFVRGGFFIGIGEWYSDGPIKAKRMISSRAAGKHGF